MKYLITIILLFTMTVPSYANGGLLGLFRTNAFNRGFNAGQARGFNQGVRAQAGVNAQFNKGFNVGVNAALQKQAQLNALRNASFGVGHYGVNRQFGIGYAPLTNFNIGYSVPIQNNFALPVVPVQTTTTYFNTLTVPVQYTIPASAPILFGQFCH